MPSHNRCTLLGNLSLNQSLTRIDDETFQWMQHQREIVIHSEIEKKIEEKKRYIQLLFDSDNKIQTDDRELIKQCAELDALIFQKQQMIRDIVKTRTNSSN
jgi:hypothetical protein